MFCFCFSSLCFPGPSRPRRGRGGKSPQGRAHDARAFAVRPGMACQRTSVAPSRSRRLHRRPRPRGSPLFGYFLWRDRESNSSAWTADEAAHGRELVFVETSQEESKRATTKSKDRERARAALTLPSPASGRGENPTRAGAGEGNRPSGRGENRPSRRGERQSAPASGRQEDGVASVRSGRERKRSRGARAQA
jgi:hypothetical protein